MACVSSGLHPTGLFNPRISSWILFRKVKLSSTFKRIHIERIRLEWMHKLIWVNEPWWQFRAAVERLNVTFCCALRWPILYGCSHLVVLARWRLIPVDPFCSAWSWWMPWKLRQCLVSPEWHLLLSATVRTADRQINIIGCIYVYIYDIQKYLSIYWIG